MIGAIIEFSARHRALVLILVAVAAIFGYRAMRNTKLDAIPDLSDTQVIVYAKWDRSPDIIEDQLTYPITSALLGMPKVKDIRGFSDFGYSYIYIIFDEGHGYLLGALAHARIPECDHRPPAQGRKRGTGEGRDGGGMGVSIRAGG